jgi:phage shock protein PspC (stress-responsive transcriptional regulator)
VFNTPSKERTMFADDLDRLSALHSNGKLSDEEFSRAKSRVLGGNDADPAKAVNAVNGLRRSRDNRWIGGVCGGLARSTGLEAWGWRLIFVLGLFLSGCSLLAYALLWIFVPSE